MLSTSYGMEQRTRTLDLEVLKDNEVKEQHFKKLKKLTSFVALPCSYLKKKKKKCFLKEAVTDARKRCLRLFGPRLGNAVYDKSYVRRAAMAKQYVPGNVSAVTPRNVTKSTSSRDGLSGILYQICCHIILLYRVDSRKKRAHEEACSIPVPAQKHEARECKTPRLCPSKSGVNQVKAEYKAKHINDPR